MANLQQNLQVPIRTAMLDSDGKVVLEWQNFFTALIQAIPGAQDAQVQIALAPKAGDVVRGGSALVTQNAVALVGSAGVLAQGPVGELATTITYVNSVSGTGVTFTTKTVSFTEGIETSHT